MATTQAQLATIKPTIARRTHLGSGEGRAGTGQRATVQRTAIGAPATKNRPAAAARGFAAKAVRRSPFRKAVAARVVPQDGQGILVSERNVQARRWGASASHIGRSATAEAAATSQRNASWRPSFETVRVVTSRRRLQRAHP